MGILTPIYFTHYPKKGKRKDESPWTRIAACFILPELDLRVWTAPFQPGDNTSIIEAIICENFSSKRGFMKPKPQNSLTQLLVAQIEAILGLSPDALIGSRKIAAAIGEVLEQGELHRDEHSLLLDGSRRFKRPVDSLVSLRLERALMSGLEAAIQETGRQPKRPTPKIAVLSPDASRTTEAPLANVTQRLEETLQSPPPDATQGIEQLSEPHPGGTLVISDKDTHRQIQDEEIRQSRTMKSEEVEPPKNPSSGFGTTGSSGRGLSLSRLGHVYFAEFSQEIGSLQNHLKSLAHRSPRDHTPDIEVGQKLQGKYQIEKLIGKGGFGAVYLATDLTLGSPVAIKVLHARHTGPADREAFKEEARRVTRLKHPNVVDWKVFEEREDGSYFFVMEFLEGEELADTLTREKTISADRTARILLEVLSALQSAHDVSESESILHLDLKPQNVFLVRGRAGQNERVKVIDFGLGLIAGSTDSETLTTEENSDEESPLPTEPSTHTIRIPPPSASESGSQFRRSTSCTPAFASPEQAAHFSRQLDNHGVPLKNREMVPLDGRSDLYSLGVMGFYMLTGKFPFDKNPKNAWEWLRLHADVPPTKLTSLSVKGLSRPLARFIDRCLVKDRDKRWQDTHEAYKALHHIVHPPVWKAVAKVTVPLVILAAILTTYLALKQPAQRFGLRMKTSDQSTQIDLAQQTLFLGPERRSVLVIPIQAPDTSSKKAPVRLLDRPEDDATLIPGWSARWTPSGEIEIYSEDPSSDYRGPVHLELEGAGRDRFSNAFQLVSLPASSWNLLPVTIENISSRELDPKGYELEIRVRARDKKDIDEVRIELGRRSEIARVAGEQGGVQLFRVPLESLSFQPGENELKVICRDHANGVQESITSIPIEPRELSLLRTSVSAGSRNLIPADSIYYLFSNTNPLLSVELNRIADLDWKVLNEQDETILSSGRSDGKKTHQVSLRQAFVSQEEAFRGIVQLEIDDRNYVLRETESRGHTNPAPLRFWYRVDPPEFRTISLLSPGQPSKDLKPGEPAYANQRDLEIALSRRYRSSMDVGLRIRKDNGPWTEFPPIPLSGPIAQDEARHRVPFPIDGRYEIQGLIFLHTESGAVGKDRQESPSLHLIIDSVPPTLQLEQKEAAPVLSRKGDLVQPVELSIGNKAGNRSPVPVDLLWSLVRTDASGVNQEIPITLTPTTLLDDQPRSVSIPSVWDNTPANPDGQYILTVSGTDRAGNIATPTQASWTVSQSGPTCETLEPSKTSYLWERQKDDQWIVRIRSTDNNGTDSVRCTLVPRLTGPDAPAPLLLALSPRESGAGTTSIWEGEVSFRSVWSNAEVEIRLEAGDRLGKTSLTLAHVAKLPDIRPNHPRLIQVRKTDEETDAPIASMRLVPGNRERTYRFHGRGDLIEADQFEKCGVGLRSLDWSWDIEYERGFIEDYYLDETEVTRGQFLAFLASPSGYLNPELWPESSDIDPSSNRHQELTARFSSGDKMLPATAVTWEEASAYARWVGKRLPSSVEWEYAVRGGAQYRPYAAYSPSTARDDTEFNFNGSGELWPVTRGNDLALESGIRNLDTNAMEWTGTPTRFSSESSPENPEKDEARSNQNAFAYPDRFPTETQALGEFYAVGGHTRSRVAHVAKSDIFHRRESTDYLGFRCAVSADLVSRNREAGSSRPIQFERVPGKGPTK